MMKNDEYSLNIHFSLSTYCEKSVFGVVNFKILLINESKCHVIDC